MGIQDKLTQLASDLDVTTDGTHSSEINWGVANPDQGYANLKLVVVVKAAFTSTTEDGTLTVVVCHGAATAPTTVLLQFGPVAEADLVVGKTLEIPWPYSHLQYTRARFDKAGTDAAWLTGDVDAYLIPA